MGAGAEIGEDAITVEGNLLALGNAGEDIELELARGGARRKTRELATLSHRNGLGAGDDLALERLGLGDDGCHLLLDPLEIFGGNPVWQLHVVVEALVDRWARRELGLGPDTEDRVGQDMGRGVADGLEFGHWGKAIRLKTEVC